uniref:hypothetical protein n=1 Tax=Methylobacterium sp. B34 TaxID=95563 RepID=UPI000349CB4D|nr:hypothetical protein [Methylobacterium sp. B34]
MKKNLTSINYLPASAAEYVALMIYRIADKGLGKLDRRLTKILVGRIPAQWSSEITNFLCRKFRSQAGTQPSRRELERLAVLCELFPKDLNLIALAFSVNLYPDTNNAVIEYLLSRIQGRLESRDDLKLMYQFYLHKNRSDKFSVNRFKDVDFASVSGDMVLVDIWRILFITCLFSRAEIYQDFSMKLLTHYLKVETDPNIFYSALYALFNHFNSVYNLSALTDMLSKTTFETSSEKFAISYFFLISFGFFAEATLLEEAHKVLPGATLHPMYIKGKLAPFNIDARDMALARPFAIDPNYSASRWLWRDAELQKLEIETRLQSRPLNVELKSEKSKNIHLLVAFFGQMRYPEKTLATIQSWVLSDFSSMDEKVDITFAVSTWRETGAKVFLPDGHIDTIAGFLSSDVMSLLKILGCCTISDVGKFCPRVAAKILASARLHEQINEDYISKICPDVKYSIIEPQENYMISMGSDIVDEYNGNQMIVNQGRMMSRIGAFEEVLGDMDRRQTPASHILFIRPDLCDLSGSLAEQFLQIRHRTNWAIVDEDAYAHVVEGVGDRYILADRYAADRVVEIDDYVKAMLNSGPAVKNLRKKRLEPHQMLRSLLFENSVDVYTVPRRTVGWNLYRGDLNREAISLEMERDIACMLDEQLKKEFLAAFKV